MNLGKVNYWRWARWVITAAPFLIFIWLVNQDVLLTKTIHEQYHPGTRFGALGPVDLKTLLRTTDNRGQHDWLVSRDAFPFFVRIPRTVKSIRVHVLLRNTDQPFIRLIAPARHGPDLITTVQFQYLDQLAWPHLTQNGLTLWQNPDQLINQDARYTSINDFIAHPPASDSVAVYGLDPLIFTAIPNYVPSEKPITISHVFRGPHELYTYVGQEQFQLQVEKIDLNRKTGPDPMTIILTQVPRTRTIHPPASYTVTIKDDGVKSMTGHPGQPQPVTMTIPGLPAGLYKIQIKTSEDVVFRNLVSRQPYLNFIGRVFLADGPGYLAGAAFQPAEVSTGNGRLDIAPVHPEGLQKIQSGKASVVLKKFRQDETLAPVDRQPVIIARGDVTVSSTGLIAIAPATLFPGVVPTLIDYAAPTQTQEWHYILADYQPHPLARTINVDQTYKFSDLLIKDRRLDLRLEVPGAADHTIALRSIRADLTRGAFPWNKIWPAMKKALHSFSL